MSKQEQWQPCPRCGSNRVESRGGCFFGMLGIGMIGVCFWVMLLIPPIGIVGMIVGAAILLLAPFSKGILQCQDCKKSWKFQQDQEDLKNVKIEVKNIDME